MKKLLTTTARLQRGVRLLEAIDRRRIRKDAPALNSDVEYLIIQVELDELEEEAKLNPASQVSLGPDSEED